MAAFKAALEVFEPAHATYYVDMSKANLEKAEALLQERQKLGNSGCAHCII